MNEKRVVIIHNHIFKNAGTTIDWALHRNFGGDFVDHREDKEMKKEEDYLKNYLKKNPNIRALSSHHLRLPVPYLDGVKIVMLTMFRHPIERVASVYNFERRQTQANTLGARFARDHNLQEYVLWRMRPDVPPTIRNFHTFRCLPSDVNWKHPLGHKEIKNAKSHIDAIELLGFVEFFNESMVLFEYFLMNLLPKIDLSYKIQNASQQIVDPIEIRIEKLRNKIGQSTFKLLLDNNWADLELYRYAKEKFVGRISQIQDLDNLFANFRKRCKKRCLKFNTLSATCQTITDRIRNKILI